MSKIHILILTIFPFFCCTLVKAQKLYTVNMLYPNAVHYFHEKSILSQEEFVPFDLLGGLILVEAKINGQLANCILDTGAPTIILNKRDRVLPTGQKAMGIAGDLDFDFCKVDDFEWADLRKRSINGMKLDISYVEKIKEEVIDAIIGIEAYRKEHILLDYATQQIAFLPKKFKASSKSLDMIEVLSFKCEDQLPIIRLEIGEEVFTFGVDTGAEVNLFNQTSLHRLLKVQKTPLHFRDARKIAGADRQHTNGKVITIDALHSRKQSFHPQEFVLLDLSTFSESMHQPLDGILGYPFLKDQMISFDFRKSRLRFWQSK